MKNSRLRWGIAIGLFGVLTSCQLKAQQQDGDRERREPPSFSELLEKMDANEDGKLSKEEVKGPLQRHFDKIDANEDGLLTEEEFEKAPKPKRPHNKQ